MSSSNESSSESIGHSCFNDEVYGQVERIYTENSDHAESICAFVESSVLPELGDGNEKALLDVGAGPGHITQRLAQHFASVEVIEPSSSPEYRVNYAQIQAPEFVFRNVTLEDADISTAKYDVILCLHMLYHVPVEQWGDCLTKLCNGLGPSGRLVVNLTAPRGSWHELQHVLRPDHGSTLHTGTLCDVLNQIGLLKYQVHKSKTKVVVPSAKIEEFRNLARLFAIADCWAAEEWNQLNAEEQAEAERKIESYVQGCYQRDRKEYMIEFDEEYIVISAQDQASNALKELVSGERPFLTCAGIETYLCFQQNFDLPEFCAFRIYDHPGQLDALEENHLVHVMKAASTTGHGLLLDIMVWRASPDYLKLLGKDADQVELQRIHKRAILWTKGVIDRYRKDNGYDERTFPVLICADIGPRGDGYKVEDSTATSESFRTYHSEQLGAIKEVGGVDLVCAYTITSVEESIGIVQACADTNLPVILSATVETDGKLPDASDIKDLIERTDEATGRDRPLFYMVNCAHPTHLTSTLEDALERNEQWLDRFLGIRANASCKSHEELDNSTELDRGDIEDLARRLAKMKKLHNLHVLGGCCGSDHEHIHAIANATVESNK